jgi:hypothetical protein
MLTNAAPVMTAISRAERNARRTEETEVKTIPDLYALMFAAFLDAMTAGTVTAVDMAVLSVMMLYDGRC